MDYKAIAIALNEIDFANPLGVPISIMQGMTFPASKARWAVFCDPSTIALLCNDNKITARAEADEDSGVIMFTEMGVTFYTRISSPHGFFAMVLDYCGGIYTQFGMPKKITEDDRKNATF